MAITRETTAGGTGFITYDTEKLNRERAEAEIKLMRQAAEHETSKFTRELRERMLALVCSTDRTGRSAETLVQMAEKLEAYVLGKNTTSSTT